MSIDWGAIVNMGSAGAVIAVVIIFLKSIKERDAEWRNFFTELNRNNKEDVCALADTMERMVSALDVHDRQAKTILEMTSAIKEAVTKPLPRNRKAQE